MAVVGIPFDVEATGDAIVLAVYVLSALFFSFLCSIAEAALLSVSPSFIAGLREKKPYRAALLTRLKHDNIDRSLAAILTLNTIAHTVGAVGAGAKATVVFGSAWFGLFSAAMTLAILFLSEIVPKTIGAVYWRWLAWPVALFVRALIVSLFPLVWISEKLTRLVARNRTQPVFSRKELLAMARVSAHQGHLHARESRIISNLIRFDTLELVDIMTPRTVIMALPETMMLAEALPHVTALPFSRLPLYERSIDHITGFALRDDVLLKNAEDKGEQTLAEIRRDILTVPSSMQPSALLDLFLRQRRHLAVVIDEFGGTIGLVTLEDLVETLMGLEIMDETDSVEDMRVLARQKWTERARALGIDVETLKQRP